jgi:RHS repeat-associated protein
LFWYSTDYRFGYQGSEKDGEVSAGAYTTMSRIMDVRLGRCFSSDAYKQFMSPYQAIGNNPIVGTDKDGGYVFAVGDNNGVLAKSIIIYTKVLNPSLIHVLEHII